MKRKPIYSISTLELEAMPTKSLLARLRKLQMCEQSLQFSDRNLDRIPNPEQIEFKDTDKWVVAYQQLKSILDKREHLSKK